jgi:hypothetical protein
MLNGGGGDTNVPISIVSASMQRVPIPLDSRAQAEVARLRADLPTTVVSVARKTKDALAAQGAAFGPPYPARFIDSRDGLPLMSESNSKD